MEMNICDMRLTNFYFNENVRTDNHNTIFTPHVFENSQKYHIELEIYNRKNCLMILGMGGFIEVTFL
jgi:hypothetical protein